MMKLKNSLNNGFTLIELLVVISIILILITVALPNFINSLVRAKYSKAECELRTLMIGIESYRSDYHSFPDPNPVFHGNYNLSGRLAALTTPLAYLKTIPMDSFAHSYSDGAVLRNLNTNPDGKCYLYGRGDKSLNRGTINLGKDYCMLASAGPDEVLFQIHYWPPGPGMDGGNCPICGPEMGIDPAIAYNPTNGTYSGGDIYRYSGGQHQH